MNLKKWAVKSASHFLSRISGGRFQFYSQSLIGLDDHEFGANRIDFAEEGYGQNPYVFMVVDRIVSRAIDIDFDIVDSKGEIIETVNPLFDSVLNDPNDEGIRETKYRLFANFLVSDVFLVEQNSFGFERMTGFIVPNSQNVLINTDSRGNVISYDITYKENTRTVPKDQVLHIKRPNITSDLNYGLSSLQPGRKVYETNNEVWGTEASIHKNKGVTGVLHGKGSRPMEKREQREMQEEYERQASGRKNFGKIRVVSEELGFIRLGLNPSDLKSIESRIDHLRTICALYSTDPRLFGDPQGGTYNNLRESKMGLIVDAVLPMMRWVLPEVIEWISMKTGQNYFVKIDVDSIPEMQLAHELRSARIGREVMQGIITNSDALEMLYPEIHARNLELSNIIGDSTEVSEGDSLEANPAADNENAQAQANLRGSVGGVQGILEIQASVQQGITPRSSAIVILMEIFGFDEQTANEILG